MILLFALTCSVSFSLSRLLKKKSKHTKIQARYGRPRRPRRRGASRLAAPRQPHFERRQRAPELDPELPLVPGGPRRVRRDSLPARQALLRRACRGCRMGPRHGLLGNLRLGRIQRRDVQQLGRREAAGAPRVQGRGDVEGDPGQLQLADVPRGEEAFFCFFFLLCFSFLYLSLTEKRKNTTTDRSPFPSRRRYTTPSTRSTPRTATLWSRT